MPEWGSRVGGESEGWVGAEETFFDVVRFAGNAVGDQADGVDCASFLCAQAVVRNTSISNDTGEYGLCGDRSGDAAIASCEAELYERSGRGIDCETGGGKGLEKE